MALTATHVSDASPENCLAKLAASRLTEVLQRNYRAAPSSSPSVAISAYSFGFLIISAVFLFFIVGCCFSRCWRPGALLGDTNEQPDGRGGRRRKLIPPVLWDVWLSRPPVSTEEVLGVSLFEWLNIQPVYVSLIHGCHYQSASPSAVAAFEPEEPVDPSTVAWLLPDNSQPSSPLPSSPRRGFASFLALPFYLNMWPWRRSHTQYSQAPSEKSAEGVENHPEAVKIAVMIYMPSFAFRCSNRGGDPLSHSADPGDALREYQIGVAQVPWIHGEVRTQW
ncbi:hypothetical protein EDD22DRAFT_898144 [Suillus occidentalis]|nr:hypothetical protein EDD22DRAFT_898144 [Suillus occidentalis]